MSELVVNNGRKVITRFIPHDNDPITIGEGVDCDIVLAGKNVATKHATIVIEEGQFTIQRKCGSVGVLSVNKTPVTKTASLPNGAKIAIDGFTIAFYHRRAPVILGA